MGYVENRLVFKRCFPMLLVPDRISVGIEIYCTACVRLPSQNMNNSVCVPAENSLNQFFIPDTRLSRAVGVDGVKVVVDGDISPSVFRESEVDIQPGQR